MRRFRWFSLGLLVGLGCAVTDDSDSDGDGPGGKTDDLTDIHTDFDGTKNTGAALLKGYNPVLDELTPNSCLDVLGGSDVDVTVGSLAGTFEVKYVSNREELKKEFGLDFDASFKMPMVTNIGGGIDITNDFREAENTLHLLMKAKNEYTAVVTGEVDLSARGLDALQNDPNKFYTACGTNYVEGLRYGSSAYVLITVTAKDQTKLDSIKGEFHANLGLNIEELGVRFDTIKADLVTDFLSNIDGHDAEATLDISVFGLNPDIQALAAELEGLHAAWSGDDNVVVPTSPNQPVSRTNTRPGTSPLPRATSTTSTRPQPKQPIDSVTFDKIGQILKAVRDTVERDLCRDQRSCEGTDRGPGFHDNHRTAAVTGIKIGNYEQLWGTPSGAMRQFREPIENLKAFVEPYAAVEDRIKRVYQGEIGEFLLQMTDQESSGEALYNYEIGTPAFTIEELNENAKSWEAKFGVEGSVYKPLRETILRCRDEALAGLDAECMTKTGPELEPLLAARLAGEAALGEYATMGRILPMNVALIGETVGFTDAKAKCAELGYRLPFANEADRIANAVAYSGDLASNSIWVAEAECGAQATMSFAPGASEPTIACGTGSAEVACVAPSGPVPLLAYDP